MRAFASAAAVVLIFPLFGSVSAVGSEPDAVAFELQVPEGLEASSDLRVILDAWPSQDYESKLEVGDEFSLYRVVPEVSSSDGKTISVHVPDGAVPVEAVSSEGLVYFDVTVLDPAAKGGWAGATSLSVQELRVDGTSVWTDPLYDVEDFESPGTFQAQGYPVASAELASMELTPEMEASFAAINNGDFTTMEPIGPICGIVWTLQENKRVWAVVGSTYTLKSKTSRARMEYKQDATHKTTYGIGISSGGGTWSSSGTKTVSDDWGSDWTFRNNYVSYRAEVLYGRYKTGGSGTSCPARYRWAPRYETGGSTRVNLSSRPSPAYTYCTNVARGQTWSRSSSSGQAYKNSKGVKIKEVIGIDLSVEGQFNTAKTYKYEINDTNLKMCGKTDYPSRARAITLNRR
jgi:hypothetical protein